MFDIVGRNKVFIIAEAGVNHNGCLDRARKLVDAAADAGADAVKFQAFKAELLVTETAEKATYQREQTGDSSQFEMLKRLELDMKSHRELQDYCETKKILFLSSAFDLESIDDLAAMGMPLFKIPSGEITNRPYLERVASYGRPIILSTGMSNMDEIADAITVIQDCGVGSDRLFLLHCNTEYPTPMQDVNLRAMNTIAKEFSVPVGYSDHTLGVEVPVAAVALGARVIEKHFTIDKTLPGPDHKASLDPAELHEMVRLIRNIEEALGSTEKKPSSSEERNKTSIRKSLVAATQISRGEVFNPQNVIAKRPGDGLSPMHWNKVMGSQARRDFQKDELIEL